ncbi:hypothetical protein D8B22_19995 [Verminephrobacter aporrectodeae subsp. tuberculatae]|nr:hypothetical protein [Verminephrobacter aporrectodeae subsp. tuberculatae]MCW8171322.1 hypothetical protein [Verminephrobacter aporrectodeae subsp. tuberculatae]
MPPMPQAPEFDGRRTAAWCLHAQQVFDGHALRPEQAQDPITQGLPVWRRGQGTLAPGPFERHGFDWAQALMQDAAHAVPGP